jgi:hypothetical protein
VPETLRRKSIEPRNANEVASSLADEADIRSTETALTAESSGDESGVTGGVKTTAEVSDATDALATVEATSLATPQLPVTGRCAPSAVGSVLAGARAMPYEIYMNERKNGKNEDTRATRVESSPTHN